ncbi:uncharacterized protein BP5553_08820 [Venustampulla echinocandica]|uniref:DUF6603 domain-containing protein n=1 Tax=Venustampulla echinocandica TaxID=2656787 RepID=A0A370TD52_9HELO|nr:uncharacterized protein BP5553_08820 [Venustampulla echinocandica]RDL32364.1 hypothetical protein BP5553_08820 [Venustampulla echinocandica]
MASAWLVESHHAQVRTGDCGIHVLLQGKVVKGVVLIDGGTKSTSDKQAKNVVTAMIEKMLAVYNLATKAFKFDTIVMSHWDEDHYGALVDKIKKDMIAAIEKKMDPADALLYLRWDKKKPSTYFYCPNEDSVFSRNGNSKSLNGLPASFRRGKKTKLKDNSMYIEVCIAKDASTAPDADWYPFAILKSAQNLKNLYDVLGVNFFTNKGTKPSKDYTPAKLVEDNKPQETGAPGIYCIGVKNNTFGDSSSEDPVGAPEIVPEGVTKTNQFSIAAVILWPAINPKDPPKCTHYFAGDADEKREAMYQGWLREGGVTKMTNMKLSHHGSRSSTPADAVTFLPLNIVMSNPTGSYFHPGWETILFLSAWTRYGQDNAQRTVPQIFATRYPFYFDIDTSGEYTILPSKLLNTKAFDNKKHGKALQKFLETVYTECSGWADHYKAGKNEIQEYNAGKDADTKRLTLITMLNSRWDKFCWPPSSLYPPSPSTGKAKKNPTASTPQCITLRSSGTDDMEDGAASYMVFDQNTRFPCQRKDPKNGKNSTSANRKRKGTNGLNIDIANLPGWLGAATKRRKKNLDFGKAARDGDGDDELDIALIPQPMAQAYDAYAQLGTNINEEDHDDWPVDEDISLAMRFLRGSAKESGPDGSATTADDDGWYIYSNNIPEAAIHAVTTRFSSIPADADWDWFVSTLHCAVISLVGDPLQDPLAPTIQLSVDDELVNWFQDVLNASNVTMIKNPQPAPNSTIIGGFAVSVQLLPLSGSKQVDDPVQLLFSTEDAALQNAFAGSQPPKMGLRDGETALVLGLDIQGRQPLTISLDILAQFVGLGGLFQNPFLSIIQNLRFIVPDSTNPGTGHRNALWFVPQDAYATTTRLQLDLSSEDIQTLQVFLSVLQTAQVKSAYVIARRRSIWTSSPTEINFLTNGELALVVQIELEGLTFKTIIKMSNNMVSVSLVLLRGETEKVLDVMLNWLKTSIIGIGREPRDQDDDPFPFTQWLTQSAGSISFPDFDFRRVTIIFNPGGPSGSTLTFGSLALDLEVKVEARDQLILALMTFQYSNTKGPGVSLEADMWFAPPYDVHDAALRLLPEFEDYEWFEPLGVSPAGFGTWPTYLDLGKLTGFSSDDSPPSIFPTAVTGARFYIDGQSVEVSGTLRSIASQEQSKPPIFSIDEIDLAASYDFDSSGFFIAASIRSRIEPPPGSSLGPAEIRGGFVYDGSVKQWTLVGSINNLTAAHFYQFFQDDIKIAASSLLESIAVKTFDIKYQYESGQASQFNISGTLGIGTLDFDLTYNNKGDSWAWDFYASVHFDPDKSQGSTFSDMLANVVGGDEISIPSFLGDIDITMNKSDDEIGVRLVPNKERQCIVFTMWVKLGDLRVQYIQFAYSGPEVSKLVRPPIKRVFLASVDALPKVEVPLLGNITQPFDEALAMWVQPQEGSSGLTLDDVQLVNSVITKLPLNQKALPYKAVMRDPAEDDVVLRNGVHLMLVLRDTQGNTNVVLDYVFGGETPPSGELMTDDFPSENGESGMAEYSKSYSGLSVRNLGLKYANNTLTIKVDAEVKFGPIDFALFSFALHLTFKPGEGFSLFNLPTPSVSLDGLAAAYNKPPITLAGMLLHTSNETMEMYQGALVAGYTPWAFAAGGCYGQITGLDQYQTFFVYARLLGPLITLEFATISGVTAGFGYNNSMRLPTVADVTSYPLISVPVPSNSSPQAAMQALAQTTWFSPKNGSFWIAAGLDVTALEILKISAVLVVEWDPNIKLGIFAIATADIPRTSPGGFKFAHVQLGITAVLDIAAGTLKIDGQLTPSSYVLDPNCHLTGGFALYSWFGDSVPELKGDFVFTLGGYHRQFVPPPQYPRPPRLGISWKFDSSISISGEAYFAITPNVCMGGGRWDVSLSLGPLQAFYNAFVDFLISFKPFYFIADGGITVGVRFKLDLWLVTIRISIDIGAQLHIEGPPIHGTVHVDFWVFGFDINFGASGGDDNSLTLEEFISLACQASDVVGKGMFHTIASDTPVGNYPSVLDREKVQASEAEEAADDPRKPHVLVTQSGLVPSGDTKSTPSGESWTVRAANFSFAVSCKVAITKATIITGRPDMKGKEDVQEPEPTSVVEGTSEPLYARPMCDTNELVTELIVMIRPDAPQQKMVTLGEDANASVPVWDNNTAVIKSLPNGLWGKYNPSKDPRSHANDPSFLNGTTGGTTSLMCGVVITVPKPLISELDTTQPFNYQKFMVQEITGLFPFPVLPPNEARFLPAPPDVPPPGQSSKQWADVRATWESPGYGAEAPLDAVNLWVQMGIEELGWSEAKLDDGKGNKMTGRQPEALLKGLEGYYLWPPLLSAVEILFPA